MGNSDNETEEEPKRRYSISDVISQIKRSIPDLRSIRHQPLENRGLCPNIRKNTTPRRRNTVKENPNKVDYHIIAASPTDSPKSIHIVEETPSTVQCMHQADREMDAVTLSAVTTACSCGAAPKTIGGGRKLISDDVDGSGCQHMPNQCHPQRTDNR